MKTPGIYQITNKTTGKKYVGRSVNVHCRILEHKRELRLNIHENKHLQSSWNKRGESDFEFKLLEECVIENLQQREQYYLDNYIDFSVDYNILRDSENTRLGVPHSEETKIKMSASSVRSWKETPERARGENNHFYGKTHNSEIRKNISDGIKKRIQKRGEAYFKGETHSDETRKLISERVKKWNEENPERLAEIQKSRKYKGLSGENNPMYGKTGDKNPFYGRTHSEESKRKKRATMEAKGLWKPLS